MPPVPRTAEFLFQDYVFKWDLLRTDLAAYLHRTNTTQRQFAAIIRLNKDNVGKLLNGHANAGLETVLRICLVLGVSPLRYYTPPDKIQGSTDPLSQVWSRHMRSH